MIARTENVTLIFNGQEGKELVAMIRFDGEKTKKTLGYKLPEMNPEDYMKLINNGNDHERNQISSVG